IPPRWGLHWALQADSKRALLLRQPAKDERLRATSRVRRGIGGGMASVRVLPVVLSFLAALFLVGCGDGGGSDDKGSKARIVGFLAEPDTVVEGESTTLQWVTKNAVSVMLVQDGIRIGPEDLPTSGSFVVTPTRNSVFRLEAADREGRIAEAQVQVAVEPFGAPRIDRFVANPGLVNKGETV